MVVKLNDVNEANLKQRHHVIGFALVVLTAIVYGPLHLAGFLPYDDPVYVTGNVHVRMGLTWEGVRWAFVSTEAGFWHPLTWLSLMLDYEMYGLRAGGYHVTNVLFHILNTLILYWVLFRMTGASWRSGFVAGLFALHPLHVESVAWVAERKDVLSGFFWMLVMLGYVRYVERPGVWRYMWVVVLFMLGLMSKPMLVTLPFVLLLLDVWPLGRYRWGGGGAGTSAVRLIGEKIPLFALAAGAGVVTIQTVAAAGALPDMTDMPLDVRIAHALVSYVLYIWKMIWPLDLAVFYPHPGHWPLWATASAVLFLGSVTALCILSLCNRPYIAIGWLWFVGTMVPVIGLVQVGSHGMADRYTYIPLIGLFVLGVWGAEDLFRRFGDDWRIPAVLSAVLLTILTGLSWRQAQYWRDSSALYGHALRVTENNYLAYNNLGAVLMDAGKYDEAMRHFQKVLEIRPRYPIAHNNAGNLYALRKDYKRAVEHFQKAVQYAPNYYEARRNWGDVLIQKGDPDGALALYEPLRAQNPADPELLNNVGVAWVCKGDPDRAVIYFRQAVRLNPAYREARENLRRVTDRKSP